ncbi:J domain-containing protein [Variovorax sp.]|uniref:J domain-containing protein n=1 Tax=Variovorax sp. TaxID=1871043 RepID=UPI002D7767AB|nr:J domain-containing protein [Variovorax sp.]
MGTSRTPLPSATVKNYYDVLGVDVSASAHEVKEAFRRAAMRWHPDRNRDRPLEADRHFKEIGEAYATLSDPVRRARHDDELLSCVPAQRDARDPGGERFAAEPAVREQPLHARGGMGLIVLIPALVVAVALSTAIMALQRVRQEAPREPPALRSASAAPGQMATARQHAAPAAAPAPDRESAMGPAPLPVPVTADAPPSVTLHHDAATTARAPAPSVRPLGIAIASKVRAAPARASKAVAHTPSATGTTAAAAPDLFRPEPVVRRHSFAPPRTDVADSARVPAQ